METLFTTALPVVLLGLAFLGIGLMATVVFKNPGYQMQKPRKVTLKAKKSRRGKK